MFYKGESVFAAIVARAIGNRRYHYVTETDLQSVLSGVLETEFRGVFEREYYLDGGRRIDFYSPGYGIGIECKATHGTAGSTKAIVAQLMRYAEHPDIRELLFVGGSRVAVAVVPKRLCGKPVQGVLLRGALA
jgi:hypothetical protein